MRSVLPSWRGLARSSTSSSGACEEDAEGRDKPRHDAVWTIV
jgi:hypothetical protein